jgi:hypothetical protein
LLLLLSLLDSKLYFHRRADCLHSQTLKLLGLIRFITYNFSSLDSLKVLYITLILSKLKYASVAWNNITLADSNSWKTYKGSLQVYAIIDLFSPTRFVIMNQC